MVDSLELSIARACIDRYQKVADDERRHDCVVFLENGINALKWLERCEAAFVEGAREGIVDFEPELENLIETLYVTWMATSAVAERWMVLQEQQGVAVKDAEEFRKACARARDWLERNAMYKSSKAARQATFAEEPW